MRAISPFLQVRWETLSAEAAAAAAAAAVPALLRARPASPTPGPDPGRTSARSAYRTRSTSSTRPSRSAAPMMGSYCSKLTDLMHARPTQYMDVCRSVHWQKGTPKPHVVPHRPRTACFTTYSTLCLVYVVHQYLSKYWCTTSIGMHCVCWSGS